MIRLSDVCVCHSPSQVNMNSSRRSKIALLRGNWSNERTRHERSLTCLARFSAARSLHFSQVSQTTRSMCPILVSLWDCTRIHTYIYVLYLSTLVMQLINSLIPYYEKLRRFHLRLERLFWPVCVIVTKKQYFTGYWLQQHFLLIK